MDELLNRLNQAGRLLLQAVCCGRGLLNNGGILLGVLVQLADGVRYRLDAPRLLAGHHAHLRQKVVHLLHRFTQSIEGAFGLLNQRSPGGNTLLGVHRQLSDVLGGGGTALGEGANLTRHHRKTAPLIARTRRLDGRIERQNIGLKGNRIDQAGDVGNAAAFSASAPSDASA